MEDMLYPMHMKSSGFGDVLLREVSLSGVIIKNTTPIPCDGVILNTTVKFATGGTGFLISCANTLQVGAFQVLGLILTAANVVCDIITSQPRNSEFLVYLEDGTLVHAYFLKTYIKEFTKEMISGVTGMPYCLPGDVALLLLVSDRPRLVNFYNFANDILAGSQCFVSGYPVKPRSIEYCYPQGQNDSNLVTIVEGAFNKFNGIVHSQGSILSQNDELIDIACSTTNGMSGGPVIVNSEIIGVYVGGPPIIGQRELFIASIKIENGEIACQGVRVLGC